MPAVLRARVGLGLRRSVVDGVRDGDEWIVNGQKVWTTLAHLSKWGLLVVRTDPQAVKHAGLTAFVVDMEDPTSRSGRCVRSPARPSSTRCTSPTPASRPTRCSAARATAGVCR